MGEARVVSNLIANRSKLDPAFYPSMANVDLNSTAGISLFSEPILCTYIDMERLIEECGLSKGERETVDYLMLGYSAADIAEHANKTRQTIETQFKRAVAKICAQNERKWLAVYALR